MQCTLYFLALYFVITTDLEFNFYETFQHTFMNIITEIFYPDLRFKNYRIFTKLQID